MLPDKFKSYIQQRRLCSTEDHILLAVSGGVDSMVMLWLFVQYGYKVGVAHCNFQLRGPEADQDTLLVQQQATDYGVPCYSIRFDTLTEANRTGESVEMTARRLRYEWFDELCKIHGYNKIAIAHHADDTVETFFINLLRGTGLRGLTGIRVVNGKIIRPLLCAQRKEIIECAIANRIPYREDSTNASPQYVRNKFRLGVIPRIREINPRFTDTMSLNVERLTAAQTFIDACIQSLREEIVQHQDQKITILLDKIEPTLPINFVLYELLREYGFHGEVIDGITRACTQDKLSGRHFFSKDKVVYIDRDKLLITPIPEDDPCSIEVHAQTQSVPCAGETLSFEMIDPDNIQNLQQPNHIALIDADKVTFPMTLRRWEQGDAFVPFGMDNLKKISDFLIDNKVSLPDKKAQFILLNDQQIAWVVGRRIDERFKVTPETQNVLKITLNKNDEF